MRERNTGFTVWFVGFQSAGKSTLARLVEESLLQRGYPVVRLDPGGSESDMRKRLFPDLGFNRKDRNETTRRLSFIARLITQCGGIALVPWVAPEQSLRDEARKELGRFVEVYVDCPLEVCSQRDRRGLYAMAQRGEASATAVTGIGSPWEPPVDPEVTVHTDRETPEESLAIILERLESLGYLQD